MQNSRLVGNGTPCSLVQWSLSIIFSYLKSFGMLTPDLQTAMKLLTIHEGTQLKNPSALLNVRGIYSSQSRSAVVQYD